MLYDILVSVENIFSTSMPGGMAELVDAADLKSVDCNGRGSSSLPTPIISPFIVLIKRSLYA